VERQVSLYRSQPFFGLVGDPASVFEPVIKNVEKRDRVTGRVTDLGVSGTSRASAVTLSKASRFSELVTGTADNDHSQARLSSGTVHPQRVAVHDFVAARLR
jgi:hypothetical protein